MNEWKASDELDALKLKTPEENYAAKPEVAP